LGNATHNSTGSDYILLALISVDTLLSYGTISQGKAKKNSQIDVGA
jgi:hypothetical protein